MPSRTAKAAAHLTDEGLAERWGLGVQAVRLRRRNGDVPKYLVFAESATKGTIRYRLADVEAYEESLLVDPAVKTST